MLMTLSQIAILPSKPEFANTEAVPFRFTPNFQRFITPIGTEGLLTSSIMAIARCLTESEVSPFFVASHSSFTSSLSLTCNLFSSPQFDLEHRLSIFIREEILVWSQASKSDSARQNLRELVLGNVDSVVRRAKVMSCKMERDKVRSLFLPLFLLPLPVNKILNQSFLYALFISLRLLLYRSINRKNFFFSPFSFRTTRFDQ
jgi:transformation/transcription domain-associated protein